MPEAPFKTLCDNEEWDNAFLLPVTSAVMDHQMWMQLPSDPRRSPISSPRSWRDRQSAGEQQGRPLLANVFRCRVLFGCFNAATTLCRWPDLYHSPPRVIVAPDRLHFGRVKYRASSHALLKLLLAGVLDVTSKHSASTALRCLWSRAACSLDQCAFPLPSLTCSTI